MKIEGLDKIGKKIEPIEPIVKKGTTVNIDLEDKIRLFNLQLTFNKKDLDVTKMSQKEILAMAIDSLEKDFKKKYGEILSAKSRKK